MIGTSTSIVLWPELFHSSGVRLSSRYPDDNLYNTRHLPTPATAKDRQPYVSRLHTHLA